MRVGKTLLITLPYPTLKRLGCARSLIAIMADACMKVNQVCALHMAAITRSAG